MSDSQSLQRFDAGLRAFGALVSAVPADRWTGATPCSDWDLRALVNHVFVEQLWAEPMLSGRTIDDVGARFDGDQLGDDPAAAWEPAAAASLEEFSKAGALDATINSSMGPSPARQYLGEMTFDVIVHRWDLGQAIGDVQQLSDDELGFVESATEGMAGMADDLISAGIFAPPLPVGSDAGRQTALLARLGRNG